MDSFVYFQNWFDAKYRAKLKDSERWPTMKLALNLHHQRGGSVIVETGCAREPDDWGAGVSTLVFADYCAHHKGIIHSVDNDAAHLDKCKAMLGNNASVVRLHHADSVEWLEKRTHHVDLLYLDSFDYPIGRLLDIYGGKEDLNKALATLRAMPEEEIIQKHGYIVEASQQHCLFEIEAGYHLLHKRSVILIDDNLPGGGKGRLAKDYLEEQGWICALDAYQSVWVAG